LPGVGWPRRSVERRGQPTWVSGASSADRIRRGRRSPQSESRGATEFSGTGDQNQRGICGRSRRSSADDDRGIWQVFYCWQKIARIDLRDRNAEGCPVSTLAACPTEPPPAENFRKKTTHFLAWRSTIQMYI